MFRLYQDCRWQSTFFLKTVQFLVNTLTCRFCLLQGNGCFLCQVGWDLGRWLARVQGPLDDELNPFTDTGHSLGSAPQVAG